ncbi:MAG: hypothetical protein KC619_13525, partial [Myxococcales bacterium]|nr:hypothetical protein [Myxococcales bacterium]
TTFRCEPDAAELAQIDAEIDTGAYGWVRSIEGGCGPGDSTCSVRPLAGHRLHFAPQELCDWSTLSDLSDEALGDLPTAVTDERGVYQVELPFGGQCAISTDTVTGERTMTGVVSIIDTVLTPVDVAYDHGAY